jgi:hypothetical protein
MKTFLAILLVAAGGYLAYAHFLRVTPRRACLHLNELCSDTPPDPEDQKSCVALFDQLDAQSTTHPAEAVECVLDAHSCAQAAGCTAGAAMKLGVGTAHDFIDGLEKSMK